MALLEEACEEANDTLIRRFGGSGLTYLSEYFLNQQPKVDLDGLLRCDGLLRFT